MFRRRPSRGGRDAGLLWISWWCVLGAARFRGGFFRFFFFERTRPAASMRLSCLIFVSTSIVSSSTIGVPAVSYRVERQAAVCVYSSH